MMRRTGPNVLVGLLAAVLLAACGSGTTAVVESVSAADAAGLLAAEPPAVLLDIRTPEEFAAGRLEGAVNIDYYATDFADRLEDLDRDATYVIYCRSGNRTTAALELFRDLGFTSVHAVDGGILSWESTGHPVVRG
jgi:rhodanese-related sulfurtransferase